ncbi:hypothetical protein EDB85DRAFT_114805 [Lactarius pseudohatsudake]|nr:hypothetical protein EDB85DRAFT_114805 [Lactarius pseudohatsudake]
MGEQRVPLVFLMEQSKSLRKRKIASDWDCPARTACMEYLNANSMCFVDGSPLHTVDTAWQCIDYSPILGQQRLKRSTSFRNGCTRWPGASSLSSARPILLSSFDHQFFFFATFKKYRFNPVAPLPTPSPHHSLYPLCGQFDSEDDVVFVFLLSFYRQVRSSLPRASARSPYLVPPLTSFMLTDTPLIVTPPSCFTTASLPSCALSRLSKQ